MPYVSPIQSSRDRGKHEQLLQCMYFSSCCSRGFNVCLWWMAEKRTSNERSSESYELCDADNVDSKGRGTELPGLGLPAGCLELLPRQVELPLCLPLYLLPQSEQALLFLSKQPLGPCSHLTRSAFRQLSGTLFTGQGMSELR